MLTERKRKLISGFASQLRHDKPSDLGKDLAEVAMSVYRTWDSLYFPADSDGAAHQDSGMADLAKIVNRDIEGQEAEHLLRSAMGYMCLSAPEAYNYVPFTPFESFWSTHKQRTQYEEAFGDRAYEKFRDGHFAEWLDQELPRADRGDGVQLNEYATQLLFRDYYRRTQPEFIDGDAAKDKAVEDGIVQVLGVLAYGVKHCRWELPAVEGILTADYWRPLVADQFANLSDGSHLEQATGTTQR